MFVRRADLLFVIGKWQYFDRVLARKPESLNAGMLNECKTFKPPGFQEAKNSIGHPARVGEASQLQTYETVRLNLTKPLTIPNLTTDLTYFRQFYKKYNLDFAGFRSFDWALTEAPRRKGNVTKGAVSISGIPAVATHCILGFCQRHRDRNPHFYSLLQKPRKRASVSIKRNFFGKGRPHNENSQARRFG